MRRVAMFAALCALVAVACSGEKEPSVNPPKLTDGRVNMAKVGGRPIPVFEFNCVVREGEAKIVGARVMYATGAEGFKAAAGSEGPSLVAPKTLEGQYVASQQQIRGTVDPAKLEELATYLNGPDSKVAFQFEVDWKAPDDEKVYKHHSSIFTTDNATILGAGLATEVRGGK